MSGDTYVKFHEQIMLGGVLDFAQPLLALHVGVVRLVILLEMRFALFNKRSELAVLKGKRAD